MDIKARTLELTINYINQVMETECIFCYGTRTSIQTTESIFSYPVLGEKKSVHFDMLVITTNVCPLPDFIGRVEDIHDVDVTVSLVVRTRAALFAELHDNNRFFHSVIKKGKLVDSNIGKDPISQPSNFDERMDRELTREYWNTCYTNGIRDRNIGMNNRDDDDICFPLYSKSLVQICQGLIYVCLGFKPDGYTLEQMVDLCSSIDLKFADLMPKVTERDIFQYKVLMQGFWKKEKGVDMEPFGLPIFMICEEFTEYARQLCDMKLRSINKV